MSEKSAVLLLEKLLEEKHSREKNGYVQVLLDGQWCWLHRVIAKEKMGADIFEGFEVHHIDGDKKNNHPDNMKVLSKEEHQALHQKEKQQKDVDVNERVRDFISERIKKLQGEKQHQEDSVFSFNLEKIIVKRRFDSKHDLSQYFDNIDSLDASYFEDDLNDSVCARCDGTGHLPEFNHVEGDVCFSCGGSGYT